MDLKTATEMALSALEPRPARRSLVQNVLDWLTGKARPAFKPAYQATVRPAMQAGFVGVYDRWIVKIEETTPGVFRVSMQDIELRRGEELVTEVKDEAAMTALMDAWHDKMAWWNTRLTIFRLQAGQRYRVLQNFRDYHDTLIKAGTVLTFVSQNSVPYHGGITLKFAEQTIYLQDEVNADILSSFDLYFEPVVSGVNPA